jgi:hypothetical protein
LVPGGVEDSAGSLVGMFRDPNIPAATTRHRRAGISDANIFRSMLRQRYSSMSNRVTPIPFFLHVAGELV